MNLTRRQLLTLLTAGSAAAVASCTFEPRPQPAPSATTPSPLPSDPSGFEPGVRRSPLSAAASRWQPTPGEVRPEIKRTAAAFLETAGTWSDDDTAVGSLVRAGAPPSVASTASILHLDTARAGELTVVYPQYGGLASDTAAVIALVEQKLDTVSGPLDRELVVDVRLARPPGGGLGRRAAGRTDVTGPVSVADGHGGSGARRTEDHPARTVPQRYQYRQDGQPAAGDTPGPVPGVHHGHPGDAHRPRPNGLSDHAGVQPRSGASSGHS